MEWHWDPKRAHWLQWDAESKVWVANHKPLPQWFIDAGGEIPASILLRLWKDAKSCNDLHKELFWLSKVELKQLMEHLINECMRFGVEPPSQLPFENGGVGLPLSEWLEQGLVVPIEGIEDAVVPDSSESAYDPMQALFEAQEKRSDKGLTESRPFFQTVEQGKFTAKH